MDEDESALEYRFSYGFCDGQRQRFVVRLDGRSLGMLTAAASPLPDWTRLSYGQCQGCPLRARRRCPAAVGLTDVVRALRGRGSSERARVAISTETWDLSMRGGLSVVFAPLFRLILMTSGCPVLDRFRPFALPRMPPIWTRLTVGELAGGYLLAQFLRRADGAEPDWEMREFPTLLKDVSRVLSGLCARIRMVSTEDGSVNALLGIIAATELAHVHFVRDQRGVLRVGYSALLDSPLEEGPKADPASSRLEQ